MHSTKHTLRTVIAIVLTASVLLGTVVYAKRNKVTFTLPDTTTAETGTNRYTMLSELTAEAGNGLTTDGYHMAVENDALSLWLDESNTSLRVLDKKSGYVWGESPNGYENDLNDMWNAMANTLLTVFYFDVDDSENQYSLPEEGVTTVCTTEGDTVRFDVCFDRIDIRLSFTVQLFDDRFELHVVPDSLQENGDNKISRLYFLPFFGSTLHGGTDGYFFVPDGSGALMRFDPNTLYDTPYVARVYGLDSGVDTINGVNDLQAKRPNDYLTDEYTASVPVYGIVHGAEQHAAMAVLTDSAEYATISASLAGETIPYNHIGAYFEYRKMYNKPVSKSNSIYESQEEAADITPGMAVYLLSGEDASYSGMARKYRRVLEQQGVLTRQEGTAQDIPLRVEAVAAEIRSGFLFNGTRTLTTLDQAKEIYQRLNADGITHISFVLSGWQKGGLNGNRYGTTAIQRSVGTASGLRSLADYITGQGGHFSLGLDPIHINKSQGRISYLVDTTASKELSHYYLQNTAAMFQETYVISPRIAANTLTDLSKTLSDYDLSLDSIGKELPSDYSQKQSISRTDSLSLFVKTMAGIGEDRRVSVATPNAYLWAGIDEITSIPMMNSQFTMETDSVPFLQMVLKGYISYYAPYANEGFYRQTCILRTIEYGAYPSFLVMGAENSQLLKTPLVDRFSLCFDDWEGTIGTTYQKVNTALSAVEGATMQEHRVLASGVVRVQYDNGVSVYVNYNSDAVTVDGVTVEGLDFAVKRG